MFSLKTEIFTTLGIVFGLMLFCAGIFEVFDIIDNHYRKEATHDSLKEQQKLTNSAKNTLDSLGGMSVETRYKWIKFPFTNHRYPPRTPEERQAISIWLENKYREGYELVTVFGHSSVWLFKKI